MNGIVVENISKEEVPISIGNGVSISIKPGKKFDLTPFLNSMDVASLDTEVFGIYDNARLCQKSGEIVYSKNPWRVHIGDEDPAIVSERVLLYTLLTSIRTHRRVLWSDDDHLVRILPMSQEEWIRFHSSGMDMLLIKTDVYTKNRESLLAVIRRIKENVFDGKGKIPEDVRLDIIERLANIHNALLDPSGKSTPKELTETPEVNQEETLPILKPAQVEWAKKPQLSEGNQEEPEEESKAVQEESAPEAVQGDPAEALADPFGVQVVTREVAHFSLAKGALGESGEGSPDPKESPELKPVEE